MRIRNLKKLSVKALGILCAVAIVFGCMPFLGSLFAAADDVTVFNFENGEYSETNTKGTHVGAGTSAADKFTTDDDKSLYYQSCLNKVDYQAFSVVESGEQDQGKVLQIENDTQRPSSKPRNWTTWGSTNTRKVLWVLNGEKGPYKLKANKTYSLTLKYKVVSAGVDVSQVNASYLTLVKGIAADSTTRIGATSTVWHESIGSTDKKDEYKPIDGIKGTEDTFSAWDDDGKAVSASVAAWHTLSTTFSGTDAVTAGGKTYYPYIAIYGYIAPQTTIYIDDIQISAETLKTTVTFDANGGTFGGTTTKAVTGEIGAAYSVATPTREDYIFTGWYVDQQGTNPAPTVFPSSNTTYYAGWSNGQSVILDFEPTGDGTNSLTSGKIGDSVLTSFSDKSNIWSIQTLEDGNQVLQVKDPGRGNTSVGSNTFYQTGVWKLNDGTQTFSVTEGKSYTLSFQYNIANKGTGSNGSNSWLYLAMPEQIATGTVWGELKAAYNVIADAAHGSDTAKRILPNYGEKPLSADLAGNTMSENQWTTFVYKFTAKKTGEIALAHCTGPESVLYLDNIALFESGATTRVIGFDSTGGSLIAPIAGNGDASIFLPDDPTRNGYDFVGWYSDKKYSKKFAGKTYSDIDEPGVVLYARWKSSAKQDVTVYNFDDGLMQTTGTADGINVTSKNDGDQYNIWSVADLDGNKALKLSYDSANTADKYEPGVILLNDGVSVQQFTPGTTYTVALKYKVASGLGNQNSGWLYLAQGVDQTSASATDPNGWGALTPKFNAFDGAAHGTQTHYILGDINSTKVSGGMKDVSGNKVVYDQWNYIAYTFKASDNGFGNYVGFAACAIPGMTVYIDDVIIAESPYKPVMFETNGGSYLQPVYGKGDTKVAMPAKPIKAHYNFDGWYTDAKFEHKYVQNKYSDIDDALFLYAKWVEKAGSDEYWVVDFEDGSTTATGTVDGVQVVSYKDANAYRNPWVLADDGTGNTVLKFYKPDGNGIQHYKNGSFILNKDGEVLELTPGKKYTVSMRVKIVSLNAQATARVTFAEDFKIGDTGNYNEFGDVHGDSSAFCSQYTAGSRSNVDYELIKDIPNGATPVKDVNGATVTVGEWCTITKEFTAYSSKTNGNLYVGFMGCCGVGMVIYFDDIAILPAEYKYVAFNAAGGTSGGMPIESKVLKTGDKFDVPEMDERENYNFLGWYTSPTFDPATKVTVKQMTVGDSSITLYAKWKSLINELIDFEEPIYSAGQTNVNSWSSFGGAFFLNRESQLSHGTAASFDPAGCHGGSSSVLVKYSASNSTSTVLLRTKNSPDGITVLAGQVYKAEFYYKAAYGNPSNMSIQLATSTSAPTGWYKTTHLSGIVVSELKPSDGWQKATIIYINDTGASVKLHLGVDLSGKVDNNAGVYIDDIILTQIDDDESVIGFDIGDGSPITYSIKKIGSAFDAPVLPNRPFYNFAGWFLDSAFTKPFNSTKHTAENLMVYGKWVMKAGAKIKISFENDYNQSLPSAFKVASGNATDGSHSLYFNMGETGGVYAFPITIGDELLTVSKNQRFAVSFDYYLNAAPYDSSKQLSFSFFSAKPGFANSVTQTFYYNYNFDDSKGRRYWVRTTAETHVWNQYSDVLIMDNASTATSNILYFVLHQGDRVSGYVDNIVLTPLADNEVGISSGACIGYTLKNPVTVCKRNTLFTPTYKPTRPGDYRFLGWYTDNALTEPAVDMKTDDNWRIFPKWALAHLYQDFEDSSYYNPIPGVRCMGLDFEIYKPGVAGYNKANVHHGTTSIHRIGNTHYFENFQVIPQNPTLGSGTKYKVTFWVKMDSSLHTDGAIQISSSNSYGNPYDQAGDIFAAVALEDLADHQWHKVDFTFDTIGRFFNVRTPGYASLYFDNFAFEFLGDNAVVSDSCPVKTAYEEVRRDSQTIEKEEEKIVDASLLNRKNADVEKEVKEVEVEEEPEEGILDYMTDSDNLPWVIGIGAAAIVVIAGVIVLIVVLKKRKSQKAQKLS